MKKQPPTDAAARLRSHAEELQRQMRTDVTQLPVGDVQKLVQELQVRQIELELQNEQLRRKEVALEAEKEHFASFYNLAAAGFATLDENGVILKANRTLATLLGVDPSELVHHPFTRFIFKDDQDIYYLFRQQLLETTTSRACELRMVKPVGPPVWVHLAAMTAPADDGTPVCRLVMNDVTERKQAQTALRKNEMELRAMAESTPQIVWACTPDGLNIYFNQQWVDYTGLTLEESYGHGWVKPFHPDDQTRAWAAWENAVHHDGDYSVECRLRRADGTYHWWLIRGQPQRDEAGKILKWFGTCTDIEVLKLTVEKEQAARLEAERFRTAMDQVNACVYFKDVQSRYLYANQPTQKLFGLSAESLVGCGDTQFFPRDTVRRLREIDARVFRGQQTSEEVEVRNEQGQRRVYWEVKTPIYADAGRKQVCGLLGISTDITERKLMEEALEHSRQLLAESEAMGKVGGWEIEITTQQVTWTKTVYDIHELEPNRPITVEQAIQFYTPASRPIIERAVRDAVTSGEPFDVELEIITAKGNLRSVHAIGHADLARGKVFGFFQDITERKETEEALVASEARFRATFEQAAVGMAEVGLDGRWLRVNQRICEIVGDSREELLTKNFQDITHPDDLATDLGLLRQLLAGERQTYSLEKRYYRKDKSIVPVNLTVALVRDAAGQPLHFISVVEDITLRKAAQEQLRASEAKNRSLVSAIPDLIFTIRGDGEYLDVHASDPRMLLLPPENFLHRRVVEVLPQPLADQFMTAFATALATNSVQELNYSLPFGGCVTHYDARVVPYTQDTVITIVRDVTQQQQVMAKLQDLTRQLVDAQHIARLGSYVFDAKSGSWTSSEGLDEIFGIDNLDFAQNVTSWLQLIHPEDRVAMQQYLTDAVLTGRTMFDRTYRIIRVNDQQERWVHGLGKVTFDEHGQAVQMVGVIQDITERRHSEEAHDRLATAVEQAAETIVITDLQGTILYANPAFEKTTGYTRASVIGQNSRVLKSGKQDAEFYQRMWAVLQRGEIRNGHFINRRKDGALYEEEATISPIRDPQGKIINYVAVKRDVTREVQLENQLRQAQKMEAIGTLAGGIAHDFNNILAAIFGYSYLLQQDTEGNPAAAEGITEILKAATRAKDLVQQILTFSRQREQNRQIIRLDVIVKEALKFLRASLPAQIQIEMKLAADAPAVFADATQIYQVTLNLATNALHAMEGRPGCLTVSLEAFQPDERFIQTHPEFKPIPYVRLTVADTGQGMDAKTMERIFEPFFTTKPVGKGTGLGLAVVQGIVQSHEGTLTVESQIGQGTTFRLYFPAQTLDAPFSDTATRQVPHGYGQKLLVVDDEVALTMLFQRLLRRLGYQVAISNSALEAVALFRANPAQFDLVITDLTMPEMSGLEVARQIHAVRADLPIVLASGHTPDLTPENLHAAGICELIEKPVALTALADVIRRALAKV